jgi:MFS family permease
VSSAPGSKLYRNYLLAVLLLILAFNYVDRLALGLVLQNIKADLHLSDTQLGFLSGMAFALFYSVMGIPIARWADRGNRVTIITITTLLWSAAVSLCGLAGNFMQLLLIRVGVAVGEAGCIPPAHSLIPDYFTRAERPRAVSVYMLGSSLSVVIGYFLAGWLNQLYGWRATFIMIGLPGLPLAMLAWFSLREPRGESPMTQAVSAHPGLREVAVTLCGNSTFRHLLFCFSVVSFFGNGILQWQPAFFIRSYGMTTGELGTWFAAIYGIGGMIGGYAGGALSSRRAANNERLQLAIVSTAYCGFAVLQASIYLVSHRNAAFALAGLAAIGASSITGPLFATIQTLVPERMRAVSIALIYFFANLIGLGLGPLATGALSDALRPIFAEESLRYSLLLLCPGYLWAAWHLWRASRTVMPDLARAHSPERA